MPIERSKVANPFSMGPAPGRVQYQPSLQSRVPSRGSFEKGVSDGTYIADALIKFAGVAGGEYIQRTAKKVEADKIIQTARAQRHKPPTEGATHAGYIAHAAVALQGQIVKQQALLNVKARTEMTDEAWDDLIAKAYGDVDAYMIENYPSYATDKDFQKLNAVAMREMVPQAEAARAAAQYGFEIEGRMKVSTDLIIDSMKLIGDSEVDTKEVVTQITGMMKSMQFTPTQKESVLIKAILESEDIRLLDVAKSYKGDRSTSVFARSTKLQSFEKKMVVKEASLNASKYMLESEGFRKACIGDERTYNRAEAVKFLAKRRSETNGAWVSIPWERNLLREIDSLSKANDNIRDSLRVKSAVAEARRIGVENWTINKLNQNAKTGPQFTGVMFDQVLAVLKKEDKATAALEAKISGVQDEYKYNEDQWGWMDILTAPNSEATWKDFRDYADKMIAKTKGEYASGARMRSLHSFYKASMASQKSQAEATALRHKKVMYEDASVKRINAVIDGSITMDEFKKQDKADRKSSDYKIGSVPNTRRMIEEITKKKAYGDIITIASLDFLNQEKTALIGTDVQIQASIGLVDEQLTDAIMRDLKESGLTGKEAAERKANLDAQKITLIGTRCNDLGIEYDLYADSLKNLGNKEIAYSENDGKIVVTDNNKAALAMLKAMPPQTTSTMINSMDGDTGDRLMAILHYSEDSNLTIGEAITMADSYMHSRKNVKAKPIDILDAADEINSKIHDVLSSDTNTDQDEWMFNFIRNELKYMVFPTSDEAIKSVEMNIRKNWTTLEDGTRLQGQPAALAKASGVSVELLSHSVDLYKKSQVENIKWYAEKYRIDPDTLFATTNLNNGMITLVTPGGVVLPGTTKPLTELSRLYLEDPQSRPFNGEGYKDNFEAKHPGLSL